MATINHTAESRSGQHQVFKVASMGNGDLSDAIPSAYYDHAWFVAVAGASAVNPTGTATLSVAVAVPGTSGQNAIAEDSGNVIHTRMSISSTGTVMAGRLRGPLPPQFYVLLDESGGTPTTADWDVYIILSKAPTYDRGK